MAYQAYFRCDANSKIGSGHLMRCLTIANSLRGLGWDCYFISTFENNNIHPALKDSAFGFCDVDDTPQSADLLVVDHYELDISYESSCREWAKKIVVIDDLANRRHDCDVLIDTTFGRDLNDYKPLVPSVCAILTGAQYAFLRPQFVQNRGTSLERRRKNSYKLDRVLIYVSFTDPHDITGKALQACDLVSDKLNIDVILSQHHPDENKLKQMADKSEHQVTFHSDVSEMAVLMAQADLAIGAGGTTSWERCCLGVPTLLIEIADNQKMVSKALAKARAVENLGWHAALDIQNIADKISELKSDVDKVKSMSDKAQQICDGRGVERVLPNLMPQHGAKNGAKISLRWLDLEDTDLIYDWQNQPETRRYARNAEVPNYDEHKNWIAQSLQNEKKWPYIVLANGDPVGFARLDLSDDGIYEVSLLISQNHYGKGYAGKALNLLSELHSDKALHAEVFDENKASIAVFSKAGYRQVKDTWYIKETTH